MRIIIFDIFHLYTEGDLEKLASIGIKEIMTFNLWFETEPEKGKYDFSRLLKYEMVCNKLGIKLLIMGPTIPPFWIPKSWFLKNGSGIMNDFTIKAKNEARLISETVNTRKNFATPIPYGGRRILSYWNPEAQKYLFDYIRKTQATLTKSEHVCCIGDCGEALFPISFTLGEGREYGPWYYDEYATESWEKSGLSRRDWLKNELIRITDERLELYSTKWLQYGWGNFSKEEKETLGILNTEEVFEKHKENLNTIRFEVFTKLAKIRMASKLAKRYRIIAGAEGCRNILPNILRAKSVGLAGLICNPSLPFVYSPITDESYKRLEQAIKLDKNGIRSFYLYLFATFLRIKSYLFYLLPQEINRGIGKTGIMLKKNFPSLNFLLKK